MTFGEALRYYRQAQGLTLDQLSLLSGVELGTISALEMRKSERSKYAPMLAKALDVPLDVLLAGEDPDGTGSGATVGTAREPLAEYAAVLAWPFETITSTDWAAMTATQRSQVEGYIKGLLSAWTPRVA